MKKVLCLVLFVACINLSLAQSKDPTSAEQDRPPIFGIGLQYHYGSLFIHSKELDVLGDLNPQGIEMDLSWQLTREAAYRYCSCYPKVGVALNYFDYKSPEILGTGKYLQLYVEPVFFIPHRFNLSFKIALVGLGYLNRPYHPEHNPDNQAYSTQFAFTQALALGLNYRIGPRWNIRLAGNYNHLSNGGIKEPNKGLNYPSISLGADHSFHPVNMTGMGKMHRLPPGEKHRFEVDIGNSLKNADPKDPTQYWILNMNAQYGKWIGRSSSLNVGLLFENDNSRRVKIEESNDSDREHRRLAFQFGHEFWLGMVQFGQYLGLYLYDDHKVDDIWFHRWELDFQVARFLYLGFGIKAHRHIADYLDLKIGFNHNW